MHITLDRQFQHCHSAAIDCKSNTSVAERIAQILLRFGWEGLMMPFLEKCVHV